MCICNAAQFLGEDLVSVCGLSESSEGFAAIVHRAEHIAHFHQQQELLLTVLPGRKLASVQRRINHLKVTVADDREFNSCVAKPCAEFTQGVSRRLCNLDELARVYKTLFFYPNGRRNEDARILKSGLRLLYEMICREMNDRRGAKKKAQTVLARYRCQLLHGVRRADVSAELDNLRKFLESPTTEDHSLWAGPVYVTLKGCESLVEFALIWNRKISA